MWARCNCSLPMAQVCAVREALSDVQALADWVSSLVCGRYDFDLRTGKSETGLKACTYAVELRSAPNEAEGSANVEVWVEAPDSDNWELVELRPVSEGWCDSPVGFRSLAPKMLFSIWLEFADPPMSLANLSLNDTTTDKASPAVDEGPEPKTLLDWAVLILNTPNPELKVRNCSQPQARHFYRLP